MSVSTLSKEYLRYWVRSIQAGEDYDPTGNAIKFAVVPEGTLPADADWADAEWEDAEGSHFALCLVGPGSDHGPVTPGEYDVYLKIFDSPETPVKLAGRMEFI